MQRTIKFALAAAILSVQASAIGVEEQDPDNGLELTCHDISDRIIADMTAGCSDDLTCQDIVDDLEVDLNNRCDEFEALYDDFIATRRTFWDSRVTAGAAWRAM